MQATVTCVRTVSSQPSSECCCEGLDGTGRLKSRHIRYASHCASNRFRPSDMSEPSGNTMVNWRRQDAS